MWRRLHHQFDLGGLHHQFRGALLTLSCARGSQPCACARCVSTHECRVEVSAEHADLLVTFVSLQTYLIPTGAFIWVYRTKAARDACPKQPTRCSDSQQLRLPMSCLSQCGLSMSVACWQLHAQYPVTDAVVLQRAEKRVVPVSVK